MTTKRLEDSYQVPNPCWIWTEERRDGYGVFHIGGLTIPAHHATWARRENKPVPPGKHLHHTCMNTLCVNPTHLELHDEPQDITPQRQRANGVRHGRHLLTAAQVEEIRQLYTSGRYTLRMLGERFGVSHTNIHAIIRGKTWQ